MIQDRNFEDIAEKFARNIYGTTKGKIRHAVLWQDLQGLLAQLPQRPLSILDAGGGEGRMAAQLAALGHEVVLCALSAQIIDRAQPPAIALGGEQRFRCVHGAIQDIATNLERPADLILCHAVLESVAQPEALLQILNQCLVGDGALSLMFYNKHGLVMRNMLLGNMACVAAGMPKRKKRERSEFCVTIKTLQRDHVIQSPIKINGSLRQCQMPVMDGHCPLLFRVHQPQIKQF